MGDRPRDEPLTVEQLLARQGSQPGRRAARRQAGPPPPGRPDAARTSRPAGPAHAPTASSGSDDARLRSAPLPPLPPIGGRQAPTASPTPARTPAALPPGPSGPGRRDSTPLPPLPFQVGPDGRRHSMPIPPIPGKDDVPTGRRAPLSAGRRRALRAGLAVCAVLGLVVAYYVGLYLYADRSLDRVDALATDAPEVIAPKVQDGAVTYLVVGSGLPGEQGPASVTTLIAHVDAQGTKGVVVSVPPTALVDTPACRDRAGDVREPRTEAFAASLLDGGPACTVRAVQQLTGLRVDHYVQLDLGQVGGLVDALGGVPVCLPAAVPAGVAGTELPAGTSTLTGAQAQALLSPGDAGSDVTGAAVADREQLLLTAALREAGAMGTFVRPLTLTSLLHRATGALTVDGDTTVGDLRSLAGTLTDLPAGALQSAALPVAQQGFVPAGGDQAYVLLDVARTQALFQQVIKDVQVPDELRLGARPAAAADGAGEAAGDGAAGDAAAATATSSAAPADQPLTVAPGDVRVDVLNGTATAGLAAQVADALRGAGFAVGTVGNEPGSVSGTVVRFGPEAAEAARTVAAAVPGATLQPAAASADVTGTGVQLVLGPGYSTVTPVQVGQQTTTSTAPEAAPTAAAAAPEATTVSC